MRKKPSFLQNTVWHLVYDLLFFFFFLEEKILTYISRWEFYKFSLTKHMWRKQKETLMSKKQKGDPANYRLLSLSLVSWEAGVGGDSFPFYPVFGRGTVQSLYLETHRATFPPRSVPQPRPPMCWWGFSSPVWGLCPVAYHHQLPAASNSPLIQTRASDLDLFQHTE